MKCSVGIGSQVEDHAVWIRLQPLSTVKYHEVSRLLIRLALSNHGVTME